MNPNELAEIIEQIVLDADSKYAAAIGKIQRQLYDEIVLILKDLELEDGYIKQSAANRKILNEADNKINEVFSAPKYTTAVSNFVAVVPKLDVKNVGYFQSIDDKFKPNKLFLRDLQKKTIATIEEYVLRDGLQSQVIKPLSQILNQNINSGGRFSGFLQQVRNFVVGGEVEGRAMSYTRTYLRDSLFTYTRTFQQSVTNDLGLEYYVYSGGLIDSSRPFCIDRAGKFFHQKDIELWAADSWAGKKQGTTESSIFLFCGGWNCGHQLIPVLENIVPKEVRDGKR